MFGKDQKLPDNINKLKDVEKQLAVLEGSWLNELKINGEYYWIVDRDLPVRQVPLCAKDQMDVVLPSDWRYREDLLWLKYGFMAIAAKWKLRLEVQQRKDRKHRQDVEKLRKKGK